MDYRELAGRVIEGGETSRAEGEAILDSPDEDLLALLDGAFLIRREYFGRSVQIHQLMNAKSGRCPEDCSYCSQSAVSEAEIEKYGLLDHERLLEKALKEEVCGEAQAPELVCASELVQLIEEVGACECAGAEEFDTREVSQEGGVVWVELARDVEAMSRRLKVAALGEEDG